MELEKVCGERHATGEWAKSGNSQASFGTQQIYLEDEEPLGFIDAGVDASQVSNSVDVKFIEDFIGTTKRPSSSSARDRTLREYIVMMANSITQVANAIQSISRVSQERKMFTELLTKLSSIPSFSEEEIDTIYDNLSKNPTMIQSFFSKPMESKARWMCKEL
ncbi:hypothetical protein M5K25_019613 [Dendrobium thyrsiflorum]|uniref:Uncharacterized protein n=1 Tax=Dendrobium thyrsiflorum TaxID=117978 RepID=A0ABD0UFM4_DENTH